MENMASKHMDSRQEKESLLVESFESMEVTLLAYQTSPNRVVRNSLMMAMCRECAILCEKIHRMGKRWKDYLPLKEGVEVSFEDLRDRVLEWQKEFLDPKAGEQSMAFCHDLADYEFPPLGETADEDTVRKFCCFMDEVLNSDVPPGLEEMVLEKNEFGSMLAPRIEDGELASVLAGLLGRLAGELSTIVSIFSGEISANQFIWLARRLYIRHCQKEVEEGCAEVMQARNFWPERRWREHAREMKDRLRMKLASLTEGNELGEYIDIDYPDVFGDACFGQYIFKNRRTLSLDTMVTIVKHCQMIKKINELLDPRGAERKRKEALVGRALPDEEKAMVASLESLAESDKWRGGATTDSIRLGINRMLGVGFMLEPRMLQLSDNLWSLLKHRRGCDADKSLRITWLNIIGWCIEEGLISGGGPELYGHFFPRQACDGMHTDEYKAIDKGRHCEPKAFAAVVPLLKEYLK